MGAVIWFQSDAVNLKIITLFYFYFESYIQFIVMNLIISRKQDFFFFELTTSISRSKK